MLHAFNDIALLISSPKIDLENTADSEIVHHLHVIIECS